MDILKLIEGEEIKVRFDFIDKNTFSEFYIDEDGKTVVLTININLFLATSVASASIYLKNNSSDIVDEEGLLEQKTKKVINRTSEEKIRKIGLKILQDNALSDPIIRNLVRLHLS